MPLGQHFWPCCGITRAQCLQSEALSQQMHSWAFWTCMWTNSMVTVHQLPLCYMPVHMHHVYSVINISLFNTTYPHSERRPRCFLTLASRQVLGVLGHLMRNKESETYPGQFVCSWAHSLSSLELQCSAEVQHSQFAMKSCPLLSFPITATDDCDFFLSNALARQRAISKLTS